MSVVPSNMRGMKTLLGSDSGDQHPPWAGDAFAAGLEAIAGELALLVDAPTWSLDDADLDARFAQALRVRAGVDELAARLCADAVDRGLPADHGAASPRTWLTGSQRLSGASAARLMADATALDESTEPTRHAWSAGLLHADQARVIGQAVGRLGAGTPPDTVAGVQYDLIGHAQSLDHAGLQHLANHAVEVIDPAGADVALAARLDADERRASAVTALRRRRYGDGTSAIVTRMPDLAADMLMTALDAYASPRRAAAQPANNRPGDGTSAVSNIDGDHSDTAIGLLPRTQRLGRAMVELIEHLPTDALPHHGVTNATVLITIDLKDLQTGLGEATLLDTDSRISADHARRLACNAAILPAVLDGQSKILDLGSSQRLFSRHQRIALAHRDRGCIWPGCDRSPAWTEAHHLDPWSQGGPTDLANGCLLCSWHHHLLHKGEWGARMAADGIVDVIPPARIDPNRTPLRHQRFHAKPRPVSRHRG